MNVIARMEFELTHYDFAVQHISHYATEFWKVLIV